MKIKTGTFLLCWALISSVFVVCVCDRDEPKVVDKGPAYKNTVHASFVDSVCVAYKSVGDSALTLNLYYLQGDTVSNRPVLVYIHGGSWIHGDKTWIWRNYRQAVLEGFVDAHYVVASVDYRLAGRGGCDALTELDDCRDALEWIKGHVSEYGGDAGRIGLWGTSAGAHLSLLLGAELADSLPVRYVLDDYGPTDIDKLLHTGLPSFGVTVMRWFKPELVERRQELMDKVFVGQETELSPVKVIKENMPPVLISHGTADGTVPVELAYDLAELLDDLGVDYRLNVYPGENHVLSSLTVSEVREHVAQAVSFADSCCVR